MSHVGTLKGAEREMIVSVDFLKRGFEIFRPACATSCDILVLKYGESLRIEVKGLRRRGSNPSGPVASVPSRNGSTPDCRDFDVLASVLDTGEIIYQPSVRLSRNRSTEDIPLRWEYSKRVTNKIRDRALSMTEKNA